MTRPLPTPPSTASPLYPSHPHISPTKGKWGPKPNISIATPNAGRRSPRPAILLSCATPKRALPLSIWHTYLQSWLAGRPVLTSGTKREPRAWRAHKIGIPPSPPRPAARVKTGRNWPSPVPYSGPQTARHMKVAESTAEMLRCSSPAQLWSSQSALLHTRYSFPCKRGTRTRRSRTTSCTTRTRMPLASPDHAPSRGIPQNEAYHAAPLPSLALLRRSPAPNPLLAGPLVSGRLQLAPCGVFDTCPHPTRPF